MCKGDIYIYLCLFIAISADQIPKVTSKQIVDLTWDFNNETIYWPTSMNFSFVKQIAQNSELGWWYALNEFCASEHGGTHFDAPYHFNKDGWKVGDIPVERLIANGILIDLEGEKLLQVKHLENWVKDNGNLEANTVMLLKFHWSYLWSNRSAYFGFDSDGKMNFPGVSAEAANWIASNKMVVGVGIDTSSVDPGSSLQFHAHRIFAKNQIYNMENVKLLEYLPPRGFKLMVFPMKIQSGTGAPLRLMAILD